MSASNPLGVPAHKHPNGGGWVADTAHVSARVFVGVAARVYGGTIWGGDIRGGDIWGGDIWGGTIRGGDIRGGTIWGGTIRGGTIWGGDIWGGTIWGGDIRGGTIWGGDIEGGTIWGGTIREDRHVLVVGPIGSEDQLITLTHTDTGHRVSIGCWHPDNATIDDILPEVERRCPDRVDEYTEVLPILRRRVNEWVAS